jgi:hypothetical protein
MLLEEVAALHTDTHIYRMHVADWLLEQMFIQLTLGFKGLNEI